jgi:4-alpha-glucanotransferase
MSDSSLRSLAAAAGVAAVWRDVNGAEQIVSDDSLRAVLQAIGLRAETEEQISDAMRRLEVEDAESAVKLITAERGHPIRCPGLNGRFRIRLESGAVVDGTAAENSTLPAIDEIGYHRLESGNREIVLAVAPSRAYTIGDAASGAKLWGLAVQLYALRRDGDSGIGDFVSLAKFARAAAARGADAVAISPVHAQFSADVTLFGPYAPSNRAALNAMHIAEPSDFQGEGELVAWQEAGAAKLQALRRAFETFGSSRDLMQFRQLAGIGLERHAVFEALQDKLSGQFGHRDWRHWREAYRDPSSAEVQRFAADNENAIAFHAYLQYRADRELGAAQTAARQAGMKIGLIADLAVGTDPAGSHSWSRQDEVLRDLEIGAPPDAINREGQSWGITAFSPRGLRQSGYSAFIEMLRHALRHAGGVRIDHVMGLARLWVIPHGCKSSDGAYLRMPVEDLIRLVTLESYRHQAVILGEDLGTLPDGFQEQLDKAGISGLRVMWFEKTGDHFNPPSWWSKTAVAMTSTHDLPTVAGWWRGQDIAWRDKLGMAGDDFATRESERTALWQAFREARVADADMPTPEDGAAAADAACAFLGATASTLALLPIEDALASPEQPNLPGTVDEHPNWRRRLPSNVDELLDRPDVAARLAALQNARKAQ